MIETHIKTLDSQLLIMDEISIVLALALVGGLVARFVRLPPIVGYLLAGVVMGPFTPGFLANHELAEQLGEMGVVLLMFGVGLHFSFKDLMSVKGVAIPGAIGQSVIATLLTIVVAKGFGWSYGAGLVLGLTVSVASTVVLIRALMARNQLETQEGRVAVGWLIVEDLFSVLILIMLPVLATSLGGHSAASPLATDSLATVLLRDSDSVLGLVSRQFGFEQSLPVILTVALANVMLLVVLVLFLGKKVAGWILKKVDAANSAELFTLTVVALAFFIALATKAGFGLSVALGAFFAGIMMGGSKFSHRVTETIQPLRDLFGVIFFAAVGMLFDPLTVLRMPFHLLAVLAIILIAKPLAAILIVHLLRQPKKTGLTVGPALGQIGEFSFILATMGLSLGLLPDDAYQLVITGAIISITLNPVMFWISDKFFNRPKVLPPLQPITG